MIHPLISGIILLCMLCTPSGAIATGPVPVFVSIVPQKFFVEKIGGKFVHVSVMVEPGASPATYEPKPKQMVALSKARIYYAIGVPFETPWIEKIISANPDMLLVRTQDGVERPPMKTSLPHQAEKDHKEADHHQGTADPHIWLSPPLVMIQARNILNGLTATDPGHRAAYEANYKAFIMEIVDLDAEIRGIFAEAGNSHEFMVFHPSWGCFAHGYGLEQVPIEIEGKSPKPAELQGLIRYARKRGIKVIFVQPQFSSTNARVIATAIQGRVAFADPLALNWADNLRQVAAKFKTALRQL